MQGMSSYLGKKPTTDNINEGYITFIYVEHFCIFIPEEEPDYAYDKSNRRLFQY
ncbi:hypothetical protein RINTHH_3330 [Richelia intracellularis HH01]|uniref:Uncharacterized protein n=2 Tax=Richelia TaxID=98443 RepID=M1WZ41_9NOST|nr:hypothetical protein RINTHH_3330 [Richelia intracellularis HH01]